MQKENNSVWFILAGLFAAPFIIPMIIGEPEASLITVGIMIGSLFWLRKRMKGLAQNLLGSKMVWACSVCGKQSNDSTCSRCGSKSRKLL